MEHLDNLLNDCSENDKKLIKDLSLVINNNKTKNESINKKFIRSIIETVLNNYEIDFNKVRYIEKKDTQGGYMYGSKDLAFNPDLILQCSKKFKDSIKLYDNRILSYFNIINIIIHELTHARQYFLNEEKRHQIYNSCINFIYDADQDYYMKNHDLVLTERYACLRGYSVAYDVLSYIYPIEKIRKLRTIIFQKLLYGYSLINDGEVIPAGHRCVLYDTTKIITPLDEYNYLMETNSFEKVNIDSANEFDLYDRFYLGLDIDVYEYFYIFNTYSDVFFDIASNDSVKTIIKKLTMD